MIGAVVLAAGNSQRMGRPKALLEWKGEPFVEVLCGRLREAGLGETVVVLGRDAEKVLAGWRRGNEKVAVNPRPDDGMISSLNCGLRALPPMSAAFVCLVDAPLARVETLAALADVWRGRRGWMVVPRHNGKRGHPLVLDQAFFHETALAPLDQGLHWVTHRHADRMLDLDVDDPGVVRDADTPEDYEKVLNDLKDNE